MIRIAVVLGDYPPVELALRRDRILAYSTPEVEVGVVRASATPYVRDIDGRSAEATVPSYVDAFRRAEAEGYHAVIPLGALDIGVDAGRRAVDIPVVGPLEATLHLAAMLGRRVGLIAYSENLVPTIEGLVERYGLSAGVGGYSHVGTPITELSAAHDQLHGRFVTAARELIARKDIDVIVSAGISLCPIHIDRTALEKDLDLPVVEAIAAPIELAAALARSRSRHSRRTWPRDA